MTDRPAAIVTGASRGIGRAIALELASLGYDVVVNRVQQARPEVVSEIERLGCRCEFVPGDVSKSQDRARIVGAARAAFGRCDMLVNNAGVSVAKRVDMLEATEASFERVVGINLKGPYFLSQLVARWMIEQRAEHAERPLRIVNIGSISSYTSSPARGEYCISKAGMTMMTRLYADRLGQYNIGVFEISPGVIETDMTSVVKDKYDRLIAEGLTPIRRWGRPEDVAKAVGAIAQGRFDFSTGCVINVDGGFHFKRL